jgi:hypothetical protein
MLGYQQQTPSDFQPSRWWHAISAILRFMGFCTSSSTLGFKENGEQSWPERYQILPSTWISSFGAFVQQNMLVSEQNTTNRTSMDYLIRKPELLHHFFAIIKLSWNEIVIW